MATGDGALTFVLEKLTQALTYHVNLKAGAGYELKKLRNEVRILESFLKDHADIWETTATFKEKEKQIREIVYDVEDIIDTYLTQKVNETLITRFFAWFRTGMEKELKSIRQNEVLPIVADIKTNFGDPQRRDETIKDGTTAKSYVTVFNMEQQPSKLGKVVDFQDEATVRGYLTEKKKELDVIAVTGMPGLGKTTFARNIFEHESIVKEFDLRIWVSVSEDFNREDTLRDILRQIVPKDSYIPNYDDLSDAIRGKLEKESFLLVIDGLWTIQDWDVIHQILPKYGKGKVLVTTRMNEVAKRSNIYRNPHKLQCLGATESLELLKLKVFDNLEYWPDIPELEEIGKDIVKKCGGVPLMILVVGGILKGLSTIQASTSLIDNWLDVSNRMSYYLENEKDEQNKIKKTMELSYTRLSNEQRLCFLYTGLFPKNQEISASTLFQLWIAEGFVQKVKGDSLDKTAEGILDTLINMNLLVIIRKGPDQVKTCRVHDMMRGFCIAIAEDQNLFREMTKADGVYEPPMSEVPKFRRVCLNLNPAEFLLDCRMVQNLNFPCVRSFLCFSEESVNWDAKHSEAFNKLRVLNCKFINFQQFPEVKNLTLLKHVALSLGKLKDVPEEISQLVNLQTLIVLTTSSTIKVKANIWEMMQLRRLKTKANILLDDKCWKGDKLSTSTLQMISRLSYESCKASIAKRAPHLKVLAIQGDIENLCNTLTMSELSQLEKLKLVNNNAKTLVLRQHCFPPMLKSLTLSDTNLKWDKHMHILAKIELLKVLKLKANAFTAGLMWKAFDGDFPKLQFLLIENITLLNWDASPESFPSLTWLVVKNIKDLVAIPESLGKHLEKLEIVGGKKFVASAKEIEAKRLTEITSNPRWKVPLKLTIVSGNKLDRQKALMYRRD